MRSSWKVQPHEGGQSLLLFLHEKLQTASKKQVKRWIDGNLCEINGRTERFSRTPVQAGDTIVLHPAEEERKAEARVLFEDSDLLIVDKPPGVVTDGQSFLSSLIQLFGTLFVVHRLDKGTSGALLFARNSEMKEKIEDLFRKREVDKKYLTLVEGRPSREKGCIDLPLQAKAKYAGQTIYGPGEIDKGAKDAVTEWECLARGNNAALLLCLPKTGRTHQLRAHLAALGLPILGDFQYCRTFSCPLRPSRVLLHAFSLSFRHPRTGKKVAVNAAIPDDFSEAMNTLGISFHPRIPGL